MMRADEDRVDVQRQRQRQHRVHRAGRERDHDVGKPHMGGQRDDRDEDRRKSTIAIANDPSAALMWPSSTRGFIRAKRRRSARRCRPAPRCAPRAAAPPSTSPVPCSTLEAIIAPNIQLAGNFIIRSSSDTASEAATSATSSSGGGDRERERGRGRRRDAGQRQHQRQRGGQDDHAHGLHHGDRRQVGAVFDREDGDLRQRAGAAGQKRRGAVPAVDALQIESWSRRSRRRSRPPAGRW